MHEWTNIERDQAAPAMSGAQLIIAERNRQIQVKGWTSEHDDKHTDGAMADAAAAYAMLARELVVKGDDSTDKSTPALWPWEEKWWHPRTDPVRNLVKAGALIAAEIDRLLRVQQRKENTQALAREALPAAPGSHSERRTTD